MNVVADKAWVLAEPVCTELGLELIDVIYERKGEIWFLIVTVDKPGGIGVDDLSALSVQLDPLLDIEDFIPHKYTLEVSSPGVLRPLKKPVDFERFCGRSVKISLLRMIERRKRFIGVIREVKWAEGEATIVFEISPDEMFEVPFESIQRANLHYTTKELLAGIDRE